MDELATAYAAKGEAVTQIEIWQSKLQQTNQKIIELLNKKKEPDGPPNAP